MSRQLAIQWNAGTLRFLLSEADRRGRLRVLDAGQEAAGAESETATTIVTAVRKLVQGLKAEKATLLILMNRGSVDSAKLTVPPATASELPSLVQNLAVREIPGATEQTPIDFIAGPLRPDGSRSVDAMALLADDYALVKQILLQSGCRAHRVLVSTHSLRACIPELLRIEQQNNEASDSATLIVSRGDDVADVLLCHNDRPLVSRTIRLPAELPAVDIQRYLRSEIQRTLLSAAGHSDPPMRVSQIVTVGNADQTEGLDEVLADQFDVVAAVIRPLSMLPADAVAPSLVTVLNSGSFAPLLAAAIEEATAIEPAVDFANPRRPPVQRSPYRMIAAGVVTLIALIGGGVYYVTSQFAEIDDENARLVTRLNELNDIVKETEARRQLVRLVSTWENNRISWPDELRDLTEKIPSSPALTVQQLTISPAGRGTAVATFRGVGRPAETIAQMESRLRDKFHEIRIPGVREQQEGNQVTASFQATLTIRKRPASQYSSSQTAEKASDAPK
jgi:Tfp pilus assembly PilM family ATPase/Tfp pilus assembly protein PilN